MRQKVYIETSIISYLVSRPSRDLLVNASQVMTREWWDNHRNSFDIFVSELVIEEIIRGDQQMATARIAVIERSAAC